MREFYTAYVCTNICVPYKLTVILYGKIDFFDLLLLSLLKSHFLWKLIDAVPELHHSSELLSWMHKSPSALVMNKF